jgi:hypothetical protein
MIIASLLLSIVAFAGARVSISIPATGHLTVDAEFSTTTRSWSFRNAYAGALGIAERIEEFRAFGFAGRDARVSKSAAGEFRSELDATRISYTVRLSDPRPSDVPYVSWLAADQGLVMFADLLPLEMESVSVEFKLPSGWSVESSVSSDANGRYEVKKPQKAVFLIGSSLQKRADIVDGMVLHTVLSGTWRFKDKDASKAATRVMGKYLALTGYRLPEKSVVMIAPLPVKVGSTKWKAETRGSTVVLLMDPAAQIHNWIGQLGIIFSHEIFHLWIPNRLRLEGDYDWFFEGFTLYIALRIALELKIIHFKEYLDTLARVYDSYLSYADDVSLIEASERRWTTPGSLVYDKGMLVAFLYDLMVRKESGGKTTLADRYSRLFNGGLSDGAGANEAIISVLGSSPATKELAKSYIESRSEIKLEQLLPAYGLQLDSSGKSSRLRVSRELDEDQKHLLRSLGYRK